MQHAVEVAHRARFFQARSNDTRPVAFLDKSRRGLFHGRAAGLLEKFIESMADQFRIGVFKHLREPAVHRADFSVQQDGENEVVEAIDQVAIALP